MVLLFQCKYRCVKLNMLKLAPKTEQDSTGLLCDAYNTAALGEKDCTRISVMEKKRFPAWLAEHENTLKSISDF